MEKIIKIKPNQIDSFYKEYKNKLLPFYVHETQLHQPGQFDNKSYDKNDKLKATIWNKQEIHRHLSKHTIYHIAKLNISKKDWVLFHIKYGLEK